MSDHTHTHEPTMRPEAGGWFTAMLTRPNATLWLGVTLLIALGWVYLLLMVVEAMPRTDMGDAGFGMQIFNLVSGWAELGELGRQILSAICGPAQSVYGTGAWTATDFMLVFVMWGAMTLAMMVPTAAPMIGTYADIALTAREKNLPVVPTSVLIAGYIGAWLVFCVAATGAQWALTELSVLTPQFTLNNGLLAGAVLIVAGLYQFTPLKKVCLSKCRTPLPFFMANWSDKTSGIFKLGIRQGLFCVACCWALMLVMFAAGLMNVIWMAALAVVMALEKGLANPKYVVQGTGVALTAAGVALIATS